MKRALAALALTLLAAGTASADPRDGRAAPYAAPYGDDWRSDDWRDNGWRGDDHRRYEDHDGWAVYAFRYGYDGRDYRDQRGAWERQRFIRRGDQLTPWQFRRAEFVRDFWSWRLPPPPRGAAWMRLGDRLMLVRQRDAIVLDVFRV